MGRYLRIFLALTGCGILVLSFQNCGHGQKVTTLRGDSDLEAFVPFDETADSDYKIINTNCQDSQCLFTLQYNSENTRAKNKAREVRPSQAPRMINSASASDDYESPIQDTYAFAGPEFDISAENPRNIQSGLYCDILEKTPNGLIYVGCPEEVQGDIGFYISF